MGSRDSIDSTRLWHKRSKVAVATSSAAHTHTLAPTRTPSRHQVFLLFSVVVVVVVVVEEKLT